MITSTRLVYYESRQFYCTCYRTFCLIDYRMHVGPLVGIGIVFFALLLLRFCHSLWLFHFSSMLKIETFSPIFRWRTSWLEHFIGYSFGISKKWLCQSTWLFCFSNTLKIYAFSQNFPLVGSVVGDFIGYSLRISRK